ncbi:MAG: hypothetical protein K6T83_12200 [Alicyclobacillus sp.]|nr:hypothetical protein [Alicyclobacillus sp.]
MERVKRNEGLSHFQQTSDSAAQEVQRINQDPIQRSEAPTTSKRPLHPAERLTKAQLAEMGFTLRTPRRKAPSGIDPVQWKRHRKAELDWIWREWCEYQNCEKEMRERLARLLKEADAKAAQTSDSAAQEVQRINLRKQPAASVVIA